MDDKVQKKSTLTKANAPVGNPTMVHYSSAIKAGIAAGATHLPTVAAQNPTHAGILASQAPMTQPMQAPQISSGQGGNPLSYSRPKSQF